MNTLPTQMRVVLLEQYQEDLADAIGSLQVVERPVPSLRRGQVLVRHTEAAPCNPSDLLLLQGGTGCSRRCLACLAGRRGTVVTSGGGWLAGWLEGRRVACGGVF